MKRIQWENDFALLISADGILWTYAYNGAGQLTGIDYSDTTPDVSFTYDRLGRQLSAIAAGVSTNLYAYSRYGQLTNEVSYGQTVASALSRTTDTLGRSTGLSVAGVGDPGSPYAVEYDYDAYGRFTSVVAEGGGLPSAATFTYSYLPDTSLLSGMTASTGQAWTRSYEPQRNLISAVENTYGETVISRFDYVNDELGRRVSRADSGQAFVNPGFDKYAYNTRSEVIGAQRYHGTDVMDTSKVYGGRGFGYNYDPIGNRTSASETIGGETLVKTYAANELNQYTSIVNPVAVGLRGDATNTAVVTVNGNAASRDTVASDVRPWHFALPADNAEGGAYTFASIVGVVNPPGTNEADIVSTASGSVYAPPQNETPTYDLDGNLLSDGRFNYTWNGENRLIKAEEQVCPTNRTLRKVEYAYDHQGRMVWKVVSRKGAEALSWEEEKSIAYLWDNFNIIAETVVADSATNVSCNIWGLDLDSTLQGAGGVGGLLAVIRDSATYIPVYDANGNIMEYVASDGSIAAHREYDPFGGTVVATGDANAFTHWFSTKSWCPVTRLSEYQFRKYSPVLGRWLSRDPKEEIGFKIGIDFRSRARFQRLRDGLSELLKSVAAHPAKGSLEEAMLEALYRLSVRIKATTYEHFASAFGNPYMFVRNSSVSLYDLLGLKDGATEDVTWPPVEFGEGKEGSWSDLLKALWKWFESENKELVENAKKAFEEWESNHKELVCCSEVAGGTGYVIWAYQQEKEIKIPELTLKETDRFKLSVEASYKCNKSEKDESKIMFKIEFIIP